MAKTVLIIDDDPTQRRLLEAAVEKQGFMVKQAENGQTGLDLGGDERNGIDVVLLDLTMPGLSGIETLELLQQRRPELPVIVLTASGSIDTVVGAMRAGAVDFFVKPASPERVIVSIRNALKVSTLTGEVKRLKRKSEGELTFADMIAGAPAMQQVVRLGQRAATSNIPILILGESGVGKELVARAIQGESDRATKPFVTVNCGAIPENLVESILFGHEKGSFTGANEKHLGKFVEADGGTLFLDEVGELPLDMQVKLLRALQEGEVDAIGSKRPTKVDVRVISATNRDLASQVQSGEFREDLYYRLNVFPVDMPSLRERTEDVVPLIEHFIQRFNAEEGRSIRGVSQEAIAMLQRFDWPGNVRQLENTVFRAVILSDGEMLQMGDFPQIAGVAAQVSPDNVMTETMPAAAGDDSASATLIHQVPANDTEQEGQIQLFDDEGELRGIDQIEKDVIRFALDHYTGHMSEIARRLNIGRSTLYRKLREYELDGIVEKAG